MSDSALEQLTTGLSRPAAYPDPVDTVEVLQTHISVVFRAGPWVYKVKKPIRLPFLDFSTLELRKHFCEEEVRLNRRFAPEVYVGVVPIDAQFRVGGEGDPVEWAVKMVRLDDGDTLQARIMSLEVDVMARVGRFIAEAHARAERGPHIRHQARFDAVAANALDNFDETREHIGRHVSAEVFARLEDLVRGALDRLRPMVTDRAQSACDTHGDLRAEHIYLVGDRIVALDCIEFAERFRYADPVSDMAFLYMDVAIRGRRDLADALAEAWFDAARDPSARALLPFYSAYRSLVRAKVRGLMDDTARSRRHWLFALGELASPHERPLLVGVGGLPGTGKSTVAQGLASQHGLVVIRSDVVRKELAGVAPLDSAAADFGAGLYTDEARDRVYAACFERARQALFAGQRVVIDASFAAERWRAQLVTLAQDLGVEARLVLCRADSSVVLARLAQRSGDPSDADETVYREAAKGWENPGPRTAARTTVIDTQGSRERVLRRAEAALAGSLSPCELP